MTNIPYSLQQEMFTHIETWHQSKLTQKSYCSQQDISPWVFQYWLRKYRQSQSVPDGFLPLNISGVFGVSDICIHYPNGVEIHLPAQT